MTPMMRTVTWGEDLKLKTLAYPGGVLGMERDLKPIVAKGFSRTSISSLWDLDGAPDDKNLRYRAWVVLWACHQDPTEWGISDDCVPLGIDPAWLREQVIHASRWLSETAA